MSWADILERLERGEWRDEDERPVMTIRHSMFRFVAFAVALATLLLAALAGNVTAQDTGTTVLLRAFACPTASPSDPFSECEAMVGATFRVEANGAEIAESPVEILRDMGIGPGADFTVPAGVDITITLAGGAPEGYLPAPGFDPFSANVDALPQVGFGGESTGPGVTIIAVPSGGDEVSTRDEDATGGDENTGSGDGSGDTGAVARLPETGTGAAAQVGGEARAIGLLLAATLLLGLGMVTRRPRAS
jgi:hypothetical protein